MTLNRMLASILMVTCVAINNGTVAQTAADVPTITELTPLSEYMSRPSDRQVSSYPFIRCAGLFLGYNYYAGANLDAAAAAQADQTIIAFRDASIFANVKKMVGQRGLAIDDMSEDEVITIGQGTWININSIAFFYDDRFKQNFVSDGAAFGEDEMVLEDLELCGQFAQMMSERKQ